MSDSPLRDLLRVQSDYKLRRVVEKLGLTERLGLPEWREALSSSQLSAIISDYASLAGKERTVMRLIAGLPDRNDVVLKRLAATNVHGYLRIDIKFDSQLTFLVGPNGSGKTSALMLLMGLLTPSVETLSGVGFREASLTVEHGPDIKQIKAERDKSGIRLSITGVRKTLEVDAADVVELGEIGAWLSDDDYELRKVRRRHMRMLKEIKGHPVAKAIESISTPMFLGLDRRARGVSGRKVFDRERLRTSSGERRPFDAVSGEIQDVYSLVEAKAIEMAQERSVLEKKLRDDIVVNAFSYEPISPDQLLPIGSDIVKQIQDARGSINDATKKLDLPQVNERIEEFYKRVSSLERRMRQDAAGSVSAEKFNRSAILEWYANRGQIQRILNLVDLLDRYSTESRALEQPLRRFVEIANSFLRQTGKEIHVSEGVVRVSVNERMRPLGALSSGERQIVVMLAHLSLNSRISESCVFIVDEPEVSLHMGWQERFVDAVQDANPGIQCILATHSPAIILHRADKCAQVSERGAWR